MKIIPLILSGGAGTRLWPVSRELHPKPFIRLQNNQSLLQTTFLRAASLPGVDEVVTVTNRELFFKTQDEYRAVNPENLATSFVLEPFGRNTAPAVALAALDVARRHGPDAVLVVMAADHLINKPAAFIQAIDKATRFACDDYLVTLGIEPSGPETGYGYIEADGFLVKRFVEKPPRTDAERFVAEGGYLWNAGIFCFKCDTFLEELQRHAPEVLATATVCLEKTRAQAVSSQVNKLEIEPALFELCPDISIDYAVMEKSQRVAVVACDIGWSDIGSWNAISDLFSPDEHGNRASSDVLLHDAKNCYFHASERIVGALGVENLIVIDTPDALLVADKSRAQDVKHLVGQLKQQSHDSYKLHRQVDRPWGTFTILEENSRSKIKRITVKPGASLSLQMHHHRSEHWIVINGMASVVNGEREFLLNTNESTYIPAGSPHRLSNPGVIELVLIEVQSGDYLGEDDIVRFEDNYGRVA